MTRAEEAALKTYPNVEQPVWDESYPKTLFVRHTERNAFIKGYKQAEKDINKEMMDRMAEIREKQEKAALADLDYDIRIDPAMGFDLGSVNVYRDGNLVTQRPEQWKWIDPKYEYPLCLTREMDEYGDWHYALSSGKISETCQYISLAELERLPEESVDADAAMKELDEKIKLTKEHGSWKGVDVDKFMDEVRGRESDDLEEAAREWAEAHYKDLVSQQVCTDDFKAGAEWQKKRMMEDAVEGEVVKDISNKLAVTAKINLVGFKFGQKVKIIIIKDDETINN